MQIQSPKNKMRATPVFWTTVLTTIASMSTLLWVGFCLVLSGAERTTTERSLSMEGSKSSFRIARTVTLQKIPIATAKDKDESSSFDWMDLEASKKAKGACGADKCFWRSVSDPEKGYLVASAKHHYDRMKRAYEFAVDVLERECDAKHLYLESPFQIPVSVKLLEQLESLKDNPHFQFVDKLNPNRSSRAARKIFDTDDPYVVVQPVRIAPQPSLSFGVMARKWLKLVEYDLPAFRLLLEQKGIPPKSLEANLDAERRKIECAMHRSDTYYYDLQGLIDTEGNYHHIDVDSQFWVQLGDAPADDDEGMIFVNASEAYAQKLELVGKFNEMIQRLVEPPPPGLDELPANYD